MATSSCSGPAAAGGAAAYRPVAGADYWNKAGLRSYVINKVFNGVLVDRQRSEANANPLEPLDRAPGRRRFADHLPRGHPQPGR